MKDDKIKKEENNGEIEDFKFVEEDMEGNAKDPTKSLRERLAKAVSEKQEYLNNWQRERADFLNYKKDESMRMTRNAEAVRERFIEDLLPILDAYDMAFSNKEAWEKVDKNWRIGVEYIHMQLLKVLENYNVIPIKASIGDKFNHNLHESIETISGGDEDTLAEIIQSGYMLGEKVLRPVRVKVNK